MDTTTENDYFEIEPLDQYKQDEVSIVVTGRTGRWAGWRVATTTGLIYGLRRQRI